MPEKLPSLAARILAIQSELGRVRKSGHNSFHGFDYATEGDIVETLRPLLREHGVLVCYLGCRDITISEAGTTRAGAAKYRTAGYVRYAVINADDLKDQIILEHWAEAIDQEDKGANKLSTSANKYVLIRLFQIVTGEALDDVDAHGEVPGDRPSKGTPAADEEKMLRTTKEHAEKPEDLFGEKWAKALTERLATHGLSLSRLRRQLYEMGWQTSLSGRTSAVHLWPKGIGPDVDKAIKALLSGADTPKEADIPAEAKDVLETVRNMWDDKRPLQTGDPHTPKELVVRMLENYDDYPGDTIEARAARMIESLKAGEVMFNTGGRIPF